MDRRGLWDKNSSLGPGQAVHSLLNIQQVPGSGKGSRTASPKDTVSLPSVEVKFKYKSSIPPPSASNTGMLSASSPRQQQSRRTTRSGYTLSRPTWQSTQPQLNYNFSDKVFGFEVNSDGHWAEPVQLKEPKQQEQKSSARNIKRINNAQRVHVKPPTVVEPSNQALPLIKRGSWLNPVARLPLDSQCEHCGMLFRRHAIGHHMKWCSRQSKQVTDELHKQLGSARRDRSAQGKPRGNVVARVVTVGLVPGQYDQVLIHSDGEELPPRPGTRTLPHSTLQYTGHGLPLTNEELYSDDKPSNYEQCKGCGKIISTDKLSIHHRLCQGDTPVVRTGTVTIPSTHNLLKVEQRIQPRARTDPSTPQTVVCYICGRKYGSHSISIHEPQCLKKFNAQNDQLPIQERQPLPKKRGSIARVLLREEEELVMARVPRRRYMQGEVQPKEDVIQRYLESCYSDFEKELVPCKKCGRTFAPARHRKHEPNCNAKPLKLL